MLPPSPICGEKGLIRLRRVISRWAFSWCPSAVLCVVSLTVMSASLIFAASAHAQPVPSVCDRTPQVREEIESISRVSGCADVTVGHLSGITEILDLSNRGIATLKAGDFSGLGNLKQLILSDNQLSTLPATVFSGLDSLERLSLSDNQLSTLPATVFSGLDSLEWLGLGANQLSTLSATVFSGLGNLESLFFYGNQLSTLPATVFSGLGNLRFLWLQGNDLTTLPSGVFSGLGNLESLNLQSNALTTLPTGVFSGLGNLRFLGLNGNQLTTLPSGVFSGLGNKLEPLDLRNNPGEPFVFARPRLEPTGTSPGPGVVEVKLVVDETWPTRMTAALSAEGGELSVEEAVIPEGSSESAVFSVTQTAGAPVTLRASTGVLTGYFGVETAPSELILDVVAPSVSGVEIVSVPASGDAYQAADSEVIRVEVGFDEAVEVSMPIAGPSLTLTIGETTRAATYIPDLSRATTLVFTYALQTGDVDVDGISIEEDALVLAGAEIADLFGNPIESTSLGSYAVSDAAGHQVIEHIFRVFFEPAEIELVRGGAAMVVLKIEPELQGSEEVVVDLGGPRSLTGGLTGGLPAGLTVNPARATLTRTSNEADITVAAGSTADLGKATLSATLDAGASVLGNSRVTTESLTVEVSLLEASFEPDSLKLTTTEGATATVVVSLSSALSMDVTVAYRIEGHEADGYDPAEPADYSTPLGVVTATIEAGATTAPIMIDIIDDKEIEPTREAFRVVLETPPEGAAYVLASPEQTTAIVVIKEGVCDRTWQVKNGIVESISGVSDCADVTDGHLSGVRGALFLRLKSIATLKADDFSGLGNLGQLWLQGNDLSTLPATVFSGLGNLELLNLSNNQLSTLPATVFSGLGNLVTLDLFYNQLTTLPAGVFSGLGKLRILALFENQLSDLPSGVFSGLGSLENLDLSFNQLSILPSGVFSGLGSLQSLRLSNNLGAPFVFARPRLELTGTSPGPGVVEVRLVVDEPWPTRMTADLSAEGGTLSDSQAVIPRGSTEGAVFSVTQTAGAPVTLRASTGVLTGYFGGETAPSELVLDVVGPSVSGVEIVSVPASGDAYQAADSEVIRVEVGFDEAVEVSTSIAGPSLALTIGETTRAATYIPDLSGATTLVFTYVLETGDADADGISIEEDALVLAGAEIADLFGNPIESTSLGSYAVSNAAGHQAIEHIFRVFFEPAEIRLVRGGAAMVVLKIEPELQDSEEVVVNLGDPRGLTGNLTGGLLVDPVRVTLTPASNEVDVTVAAESTADLGKAELSATLDAGASVLGNSRVTTESLAVKVVRGVELLIGGSVSPPALSFSAGTSATLPISTNPTLEMGERVTVSLSVSDSELILSSRTITLDHLSTEINVVLSSDVPGLTARVDATGVGDDVEPLNQPTLEVNVLAFVSVVVSPQTIEVRQGGSTPIRVTTDPPLKAGQSAMVSLSVPAESGIRFDGSTRVTVQLRGSNSTAAELIVAALLDAPVGPPFGPPVDVTVTAQGGDGLTLAKLLPEVQVNVVLPRVSAVLTPVSGEDVLSFVARDRGMVNVSLEGDALRSPQQAVLRLTASDPRLRINPSEVTLSPGALTTTVLVTADQALSGEITVSALSGVELVEAQPLAFEVLRRELAVSFVPAEVNLVRGGAAAPASSVQVTLRVDPELLGDEEIGVDLGVDLSGGSLEVEPPSVKLSSMSRTATVTVTAGPNSFSGEVTAVPNADVRVGDASVTFESLTVEVVRGVELSLSDHAGQAAEMVTIVAGESTEITVATVPVLEGNERVTVTLSVASGLTLEGVGSALIGGNALVLTSEADSTSATVRVSTLTPGLDLKVGVSASGVGENVEVVGEAPSLRVVTEVADEVAVVLPSLPIAVQQGGSSTMLRVGTDPLLDMGQSVTVRLTIAPDDAGLSFAGGLFITDVRLEETQRSVDVEVIASPDAAIGSSVRVTSMEMDASVGLGVVIDGRSQATLEVTTPQVTLGLRPAGGEIGEALVLGLGESKAVELSLTGFMLSGSQTAVFEMSVSGAGLSLQGGTPNLRVSLDAVSNTTAEVTVAALANAVSVGELSVRALSGVELAGGAETTSLPVEVLQSVSLVFDPDLVLIRQGRSTGFEVRMSEPLVADRSVVVSLVVSAEGFSFAGAGSMRHEVVLDADKAMETVTVATTADVGLVVPVSVSVDPTPGIDGLDVLPGLSLQVLPPPAVVMIGNESSMVSVREGETAMITVRAAPAPSEALTIGYVIGTDGDVATVDADGSDYADAGVGTVTIGAGEESATIGVRITDDAAIEVPREFFRVSLTAPSEDAAYVLASPDRTTAIVTIKEGVCDRTPQVRDGILAKASGVSDCADVTGDDLSGVRGVLDLSSMGISVFRAGDFSGLGNLRQLWLHENALTTLPADVFSGLGGLEVLWLSLNDQLTTLPATVFSDLDELKYLSLWNNQLTALPATVFSGLGNLLELDLESNQLSALPATVFSGLGNLGWLNLAGNRLTTLPTGVFSGLENLSTLVLSVNALSALPATVFSGLGNLESLDLRENPGAPFVFARPRLEQTGTSVPSVPGVVEVKLVMDETWPTTMTAALSAEGGDLLVDEAVIPEGGSESAVFSVTQTAGAPVSLRASTGVLTGYFGVETAPSELVLDVIGPSVSGVEIISRPASGDAYRASSGEVIRVAVGFDEAVEVSTPTAGPRLTLTIWETARAASYVPGLSEASTLVFAYVLQIGDVDVDGISIEEDALVLAGARITDVSVRKNPIEDTSLGDHAIMDAGRHRIAERRLFLSLSLEPSSVTVGSFATATLTLGGAESLAEELSVRVSLTLSSIPGSGLSAPSEVTLKAGDASTRFRVSAALDATPGDSSLMASVEPSVQNSIQALVSSTTLEVTVSEPPPVVVMVDNESAMVSVEEGEIAMVIVRAASAPLEALAIGYAIGTDGDDATADADGDDYADVAGGTVTGTVTIGAGEESAVIEVRITDDAAIEAPREFFRVSLTAPPEDAAYVLASPDRTTAIVVIKEGVCDRTLQVRDEILRQISGVSDCAEVTDDDLSGVSRVLSLSSRDIATLNADDFSGLGNLRELDLWRNQLSTLPAGVFSSLGNLTRLLLGENRLSTLPADVFSGLGNLEYLSLWNNRLTALPADVFSGLGNLEALWLLANPGAPFVFARPRLEPTGTLPGPGVVEVRLVVDETLPTTMTAALSVAGGELSAEEVVIPEGSSESAVFFVTQAAGAPVSLRSSTGVLTGSFLGVEIAPSELTLDVVGPSVSGVEIVSRPASGNAYRVSSGEVIRVAVGFDEAVEVSTSTAGPWLTLTIWETARAASYVPGLSGATTLVFAYALQAGDVDMDGISIEEDALMLGGAGITDVSARKNPIEDTSLGDHVIMNAGRHRIAERRLSLSLSLEPSSVAAGSFATATLTLGGAELLVEEPSVRVSLTPGSGLSAPSEVTLKAGDAGTRFRVSANLDAPPGDSSLRASVNLSVQNSIQALVSSTTLEVRIDRRLIGVVWEPDEITLMRGGSAQVKVTAVPALQATESIVLIPASQSADLSFLDSEGNDIGAVFSQGVLLDVSTFSSNVMTITVAGSAAEMRTSVSLSSGTATVLGDNVDLDLRAELAVTVSESPPVVVTIGNESSMVSVEEGETAMITVRATPVSLEALTIGYGIDADGDDATADADGDDYVDVAGGTVTIGAGEESTTIEVRITDDEAIDAPREFFRVSLTAPPEDAAYVLASSDRTAAIVVIKEGVCDRTPQVRDEILRQISGVSDCADVTDDDLSGVSRVLSLSSRDIATLNAGDFSGLGNLRELDLSRNQLSTLPAGVFSDLGNLTRLVLGENQLSTLPADVFSGLGNLMRLVLGENRLSTLPVDVFSGLGNLERLDLWRNQLSTLPADVFSGLGNLEVLWLFDNPGEPFVFVRPRLEPTGTSPGPGVVEVKLVVDETLPTTMTAALSAEGGELSAEEAVIPEGSSESAVFSVTQTAGAPVVALASSGGLTNYVGVVTAPSELTLDVVGPSVSDVEIISMPASGDAYRASSGEIIRVAVVFDEAVEVSIPAAEPWLTLTIGETTRAASYVPGLSGASTLVFAYALQIGDVDMDGISIEEDALVLAGAGITDVSARKNPIEDTSLGDHAIMDAGRHRVAERQLSLSLGLEPSSVAAGSFATATLTLGGAELLAEETSVRVSLTPGSGLSAPSEVTLKAGDGGTRFRVSADLDAIPGDSSLRASVDLSVQTSIQALVSSTTLEVRIDRRLIGVIWEPDDVTLMRGGSVQVKVTAVPALQVNESMVLIPASQSADLSFSDSEGNGIGAVFSQGVLLDVSTFSSNVMTITVAGSAAATRTSVSLSRGAATALGDNVGLDLRAELAVTVSAPVPEIVVMIGNESSMVSVREGATAMIIVRAASVPLEPLTIDYAIGTDGDAATADADGDDYADAAGTAVMGTVTIGAGEESATIEVRITDDEAIEATREFFRVFLTAPSEDAAYVLASADRTAAIVVIKEGVCDRTPQVRDGILAKLSGVSDCADVTDDHLSGITGVLSLSNRDIVTLNAGDFSGLGNLESLDLRGNPGAPFVFARPRLEPTGTSPEPGVVEVKLVVDETLPTTMTAALSVEGGQLSVEEAMIPEGSSESAVFSVTQTAGAPMSLRASTGVLTGYLGVETAPSELVLDVIGPSVSGVEIVSVPAFGDAYRVVDGEIIRVAVGFDEAVEVSTAIAGPSLTLTIGETPLAASYVPSLSEASTLVFAYELQAGDVDVDGISIEEDALVLADAEITDLFGSPIENTSLGDHALLNAAGHRVIEGDDVSLSFDAAAGLVFEVEEGASVILTVTAGSPSPTDLNVSYRIVDDGDSQTADADVSDYSDPGAGVVTIRADETTAEIVLSIVDDDEIEPTSESFTVSLTAGAGYTLISSTMVRVVIKEGVCDRTPQVRDGVLAKVSGVGDCADVTDDDLSGVTGVLDLSSMSITAFRSGDFSGLGNLGELRLHENALTTLPADVFSGLGSLEVLWVYSNALTTLPADVFSGLGNLGQLWLHENALTTLPATVFSGLDKLEDLSLRNNQLTALPADVFSGLGNLGQLWLNANALTALPVDVFSGLGKLKLIYLNNNALTTLPMTVFSGLGSLETLFLSSNALTALPADVFSGLGKLESVYLNDNNLATLPADVFSSLSKLELVHLNDNNLTTLPADVFSGLGSLEVLWLYSNDLTILPATVFSGLSSLKTLFLHSNQLTALPAGVFSGLDKLEDLSLRNNELTALPMDVFSALENLNTLLLSFNALTTLSESIFSSLGNLEVLDLSFNPGVPFVFARPRLEQTSTPPEPGVVEVKLVVDETLPTTITVPLSVDGGELSTEQAVIPKGSVESGLFTVTRVSGASMVTLRASTGTLTGSFEGVVTAPSEQVLSFIKQVKLRIRVFLEGALE